MLEFVETKNKTKSEKKKIKICTYCYLFNIVRLYPGIVVTIVLCCIQYRLLYADLFINCAMGLKALWYTSYVVFLPNLFSGLL